MSKPNYNQYDGADQMLSQERDAKRMAQQEWGTYAAQQAVNVYGGNDVKRVSINSALDMLGKDLENLHQQVISLRADLGAIMVPQVENSNAMESCAQMPERPGMSGMHGRVFALGQVVQITQREVAKIVEGLDL